MVLLRQYKYGKRSETLPFPLGKVEQGSDSLLAAQKEVLKETVQTASGWELL